jgi:hypothetical protein
LNDGTTAVFFAPTNITGTFGAGTNISIQNNGGDGGHVHGLAGASGNMSLTTGNFNLLYLDVIVCTKL